MKVACIHAYGHSDQIKIESIPAPDARQGEALIRVRAAAVNPVDWKIREGMFPEMGEDALPLVLGLDFSGVIEKVEESEAELSEEQPLEPGDEVFGKAEGAYAEYVAVPLHSLVMKPRSLSFEEAAAIPTPALTAWQALFEIARVDPGQKVLIHGASGGVGSIMVQLCKWKGATVYANANAEDAEYLKKLGADEVIDYRKERFEELVPPVDAVMDLIGGETQTRSWSLIKRGGVLVNTIGQIDESRAKSAGVRAETIVMRYDVRQLAVIARLFDEGILKTRVTRVLPLDRAREAQDLNQKGHTSGKIVLKIA